MFTHSSARCFFTYMYKLTVLYIRVTGLDIAAPWWLTDTEDWQPTTERSEMINNLWRRGLDDCHPYPHHHCDHDFDMEYRCIRGMTPLERSPDWLGLDRRCGETSRYQSILASQKVERRRCKGCSCREDLNNLCPFVVENSQTRAYLFALFGVWIIVVEIFQITQNSCEAASWLDAHERSHTIWLLVAQDVLARADDCSGFMQPKTFRYFLLDSLSQ